MHHQLCHLYFGLAKDNHVSALLPTFSFFLAEQSHPYDLLICFTFIILQQSVLITR